MPASRRNHSRTSSNAGNHGRGATIGIKTWDEATAGLAKAKEISGDTALHYFRNQDPGAFVSLSGGGVLASSKKKDQAQQFLRFVTGTAGQQVLQNGTSFEYPVGSDVPANPALVPLAELQAPTVDPSTLDAKKVSDLMTQAGLL